MKYVNLKKAEDALVGMSVPAQHNGNVGKLVEDVMESRGYPINKGKGPDLLVQGIEIKTRDIEAKSAQTIGRMTLENIASTPYTDSSIKSKFQQQFRIKHSSKKLVIVSAKMYDFTVDAVQEVIEFAYESGRSIIRDNLITDTESPNYIRGEDALGYWERKDKYSYQFRLGHGHMEFIERLALNSNNRLFEFE